MKLVKKWLKNKVFVALLICLSLFVVFAPLTYVWAQSSFVAMGALGVAVVLFGVLLRQRVKRKKHLYLQALSQNQLTPMQQKQISFDLKQQQVQIVLLYILGGLVVLFVLNQLVQLVG